ncbi:Rrf2 family transcriptional regulator [bacterium]|nr:Rrf2 family transcriptional regulator [bacterium]
MQNLVNFSDAVSLAFHAVGVMAVEPEKYYRTKEIADMLQVSEHHLQKVHQRLAKMGFIRAVRGPKGGYALNRPPQGIPLLDVFEAIEGPLNPNQCLLGKPKCQKADCALGKMVDHVNAIVKEHLGNLTAQDLASSAFGQTPLNIGEDNERGMADLAE